MIDPGNVPRDPRCEETTFVLLGHEGFSARVRNNLARGWEERLYSSPMGIFLYPDEREHLWKQWLKLFPDKVVFGSDAFPLGAGDEENYWLAVRSARTVLAAAGEMVTTQKIAEDKGHGAGSRLPS